MKRGKKGKIKKNSNSLFPALPLLLSFLQHPLCIIIEVIYDEVRGGSSATIVGHVFFSL